MLDLRRRYGAKVSTLCILTSLGPWSSFQSMQDLDIPCMDQYILFNDLLWRSSAGATPDVTKMMSWFWVYGAVTALIARIFVSCLPEVPQRMDLSSPWWLKLGAKRTVKNLMRSTLFFALLVGGNFGQGPVILLVVLLVKSYQISKITNLRIFVLW